ncbi:glycoside hydrolase family 2 protein [Candidatus Izemoplasma sp. B36]|uniref:glycoside hydrolase family 2 protein n=1 Tax=Candidatus Izemoplasma sp. B36 TaxID=3242468 RepID=UPI0035576050
MTKTEYPRPQFNRKKWQNLNGQWEFAFDDENTGQKNKYYSNRNYPLKINVPFCFQSKASGIHDESFHDHIWYRKKVKLQEKNHLGKTLLHIGASDYYTEVYINNNFVGKHTGGHTSFSFDITDFINHSEEEIVIYVFDPSKNKSIPRGKQYWKLNPESIWYPRTTGIWQTIWLEYVPETYIKNIKITPLYDTKQVQFDLTLHNSNNEIIEIEVYANNEKIQDYIDKISDQNKTIILDLHNIDFETQSWSPENPYLFDINLSLISKNKIIDKVQSYFGMRKIHFNDGKFYLNNKEYYQKLVLDQGYYPNSLLTSMSDNDLTKDILLAKEMGFNGCRKHQKIEEDRFLYHADKLGFLVWSEMANAYTFSKKYVERITEEWIEAVNQNYNHPSIVAWVPLNESWGIRSVSKNANQQKHQLDMYNLTKRLDSTRLVSSNDGWEMMKTDICGIHNYMHGGINNPKQMVSFKNTLKTKENMINNPSTKRSIYLEGYKNNGEPIILTEFGGIAFNGDSNGWGYTSVNDKETFIKEYERLINDIKESKCIVGYCYTQLYDVFQEMNGLLNFDRSSKIDLERIKRINNLIK